MTHRVSPSVSNARINRVGSHGLLLGLLVALAWFSIRLAQSRIYQVDECQNVYMARVLATGQSEEFFSSASLFLLGPLSRITGSAMQSEEMYLSARWMFLGVFWLNMILVAAIASGRLFSARGMVALVAAATVAPLWDYGFEIRHDNLVLTGILLMWWAIRVKPMGALSYVLTGATTVILLFVAVKTIVYALPLSVALLAFPPPAFRRPRWQLGIAWIVGGLLALAAVRAAYGGGGAWDAYLSVFRGLTGTAGDVAGFKPWNTLARLLWQTPLLLALSVAACCAVATELVRRRKAAFSWEGNLPEVALLAGALAALMINPTPFPYNLIHVVPYAFLLAYRYGNSLWSECRSRPQLFGFAVALVVLVHFVPFAIATQRHVEKSNARQHTLMRLAEDTTDAVKDPVYDAIGMVPTRRSIHYQWYIHSLNIRGMLRTPGSRVRDMLTARPAAVFIPSYRTSWLPPEDHEFIEKRYVPLADDFWVLGSVLPAGGGDFEIFHPGRYQIVRLKPVVADAKQTAGMALVLDEISVVGTLNGTNISNGPVALSLGVHRIETPADGQIGVIWVGPRLDTVPRVSPGRHATLFWNWY